MVKLSFANIFNELNTRQNFNCQLKIWQISNNHKELSRWKKKLKNQKMRINLEKGFLRADLHICISSSKISTICKDIFNQQKQ